MVGAALRMAHGHRHDEARRAKAALAAVVPDHFGLHRVQGAIGAGNTFNRAHGLAVDLGQKQDAGVQGAHALIIGDHHRAGPAITFIAAFLRAAKAALKAQPIQQRSRRRLPRRMNLHTVQVKRYVGHCRNLPPSFQIGPSLKAGACRPMRCKAGTQPSGLSGSPL